MAPNSINEDICPVRLYRKLLEKRGSHITTDRLFLTVNPYWTHEGSRGWYKNMPIGVNEIGKWTKQSAEKIGINTSEFKITNHSNRSSAVSSVGKAAVGEQQLIKISGHSNAKSLAPYIQLDEEHHADLLSNLRQPKSTTTAVSTHKTVLSQSSRNNTFDNCTFHIQTMHCSSNSDNK